MRTIYIISTYFPQDNRCSDIYKVYSNLKDAKKEAIKWIKGEHPNIIDNLKLDHWNYTPFFWSDKYEEEVLIWIEEREVLE